MPAYTTFGSDGATAIAPTDPVFTCPSVTGDQLVPPFVVLKTPPPVAPM
jgi:hypothetical protein